MASTLSTIVVDIEKFFKGTETVIEKFANGFVKLFKKAPNAEQAVQNFLNVVAPPLEGFLLLADPVLEAPVVGAIQIAETGLAAIQAATTAALSGNSLLENLRAFVATVPNLLTGLAFKNPELQTKINGWVQLIEKEAEVLIPAVESWVQKLSVKDSGTPGVSTGTV